MQTPNDNFQGKKDLGAVGFALFVISIIMIIFEIVGAIVSFNYLFNLIFK